MSEQFPISQDRRWLAVELVKALALMAATFKAQVAALPPDVMVADEVALVFEDACAPLGRNELPVAVRNSLEAIERNLNEMPAVPGGDLWSLAGLEHDPRWQVLRVQASEVLDALGVADRAPSIDWATYVPTRSSSRRPRSQ